MPPVPIDPLLRVDSPAAWRAWLEENHATASHVWLLLPQAGHDLPRLPYLAAVEEALCFGWIDGHTKRLEGEGQVIRFSPRRPRGNWTELNKERARRLLAQGRMTDAGRAVLPDLDAPFVAPPDILAALQEDPVVWERFQSFEPLYQRVRVSLVDEVRRNPAEFQRRLDRLITVTRQGKRLGTLLI